MFANSAIQIYFSRLTKTFQDQWKRSNDHFKKVEGQSAFREPFFCTRHCVGHIVLVIALSANTVFTPGSPVKEVKETAEVAFPLLKTVCPPVTGPCLPLVRMTMVEIAEAFYFKIPFLDLS